MDIEKQLEVAAQSDHLVLIVFMPTGHLITNG